MPQRLIEMVLPEASVDEARQLLEQQKVIDVWYNTLSANQTLIKILVSVEESEPLIDLLDKHYFHDKGFRLILLPVAATLPRLEIEKEKAPPPTEENEKKRAARVSREELYTQITDTSKPSAAYFAMVVLSTVVAAIGLINNNVAVVIGAMVIAPLLGPNIALALGATLGDTDLVRSSLKANAAGLLITVILAIFLGLLLPLDPSGQQIASRTRVELMDVVLALSAGIAGTLAFTSGAPAALIGVMVAVALVPPLVTTGLMLGAGFFILALDAFWLSVTNIICLNLAAVATFWVQGVRPTTWWEENIAKRATRISLITSLVLLSLLMALIYFAKKP
ncbi:MAG: TIGR00341 family protein [Thermodesulfobacteriota bacterium]